MADSYSLGIDVGGTKIYAVVLNENSDVLAQAKLRTDPSATPARIAEQIKTAGSKALSEIGLELKQVKDIGIAIPSSIDPETGDCLHAPNLGLKNFSIKEHFKNIFDKEVYLGNDGNCGILGEISCGAAKGFKSAVGYFVGTGLGGGIVIDGKLLTGNGGVAGELGHAIVRYNGVRCNCGNKGCIEAYCSKAGFVKALKKEIIGKSKDSIISDHINKNTANIKSKFLAKAYQAEDKVVCKTLHKGMKKLGAAAASMSVTIAPECIVLGGGVMEAMGEKLLPVFQESFEKHLFGIDPAKIKVRLSALKDYAVAVGATILAKNKGKA